MQYTCHKVMYTIRTIEVIRLEYIAKFRLRTSFCRNIATMYKGVVNQYLAYIQT